MVRTLGLAKLAGVNGLQILKSQPLLAITIPTTGAMFFYGCGAIFENNTIGKVFTTTADVLALPMKGVELMWNSYANPAFQKVFGIPIILNLTQTFKLGPGYTIEEMAKYIPVDRRSFIENITDYIRDKLTDLLKKKTKRNTN